jgi:Tol biopolymer transport system component
MKQEPDVIVFSVAEWEGEYWSEDRPGGVDTPPTRGAIYTIHADGTNLRKVAAPGGHAHYAHFSPDGQFIYFQSNARGPWDIYRCRPDGSGLTNLTKDHALSKASYGYDISLDGKLLVYSSESDTCRIAIMKADGAEPRLVAPDLVYHYMASFSPDSNRVVFAYAANHYRLFLCRLDGSERIPLTPDLPGCMVPQFTPDGKTIFFLHRDGEIYRIDPDGRNLKRLTQGNDYNSFHLSEKDKHGSRDAPDASHDGARLAYVGRVKGIPQVFTMKTDGSSRRQITHRPTACARVQWSPDDTRVSFISFEGKFPQLSVVQAQGGEPRQLTNVQGAVDFPRWKPRHQ